MGTDKAFLNMGGRTLLESAIERLRLAGASEVLISGRADIDYEQFQTPVLLDQQPGNGPLGGIERGLAKSAHQLVFFLAVDLPDLTSEFVQRLWQECDSLTGIVPSIQSELEPLAAFYPKTCHAIVLEQLESSQRSARAFAEACLKKNLIRLFPVNARHAELFRNLNAPADLS